MIKIKFRSREIDIVSRLVEHFETKLKGLKEYMVARPDEAL